MSVEDVASTLKCDQNILSMIYNISSEQHDGKFISVLNKTISSSKCYLKGLELLCANIEILPLQIVLENAFLWINICIGNHHKHLKQIKLSIIGKIIERAYKDQDFTKKLLADYMTKIMVLCLSNQVDHYEMESALFCLKICMKRYGSWFGAHKSQIENFLLNILFCHYKNVIEISAEAFIQLQQVGGGGVDGVNHRHNFSSSFHKLCTTTHKLFDKLFENETELEQFDFSSEESFLIPEVLSHAKLELYIENCLTFIKTMMMKGFPAVKDIKPIEVLNLIVRGTVFHLCLSESEKNTLENVQYSVSLNHIQIMLLELLNVLIVWCQGNVLPFSYTISKVLTDCLSRSQKCKCFKINSYYREKVYMALNYWIRVSRCALNVNFQNKLLDCILEDITPTKGEVKLILNRQDTATSRNKRVLKEHIIGENASLRSTNDAEVIQRQTICCAALVTLKYLISNSWLRVNTEKLEDLYCVLIGTTQEIIAKKHVIPYTNATCQEKLFEVLVSFYEENSLSVFPNINAALYILNKGRNSKNLKISSACQKGINYLEVLCQPICPSLGGSENSIQSSSVIFNELPPETNENEIDLLQRNGDQTMEGLESVDNPSSTTERLEYVVNQNSTTERLESVTTHTPSADDENHLEDVMQESSVVTKSSVHILDVQVISTSNREEAYQTVTSANNILNRNDTSNSSHQDEVFNEVLNASDVDGKKEEDIPVENLSKKTSDQSLQESENDGPPSKVMKLEEKSIEIFDDDFVDEVKDY